MIVLSFCITVYNQSELVRACVESIISCKSNEIEIVINDDCSTEDINGLVNSWSDERIRYYRNEINLGHDLNILKSYENARGKYLYLLRTRDKVIASQIETMLKHLKNNEHIVYATGTAIDEDGKVRLEYKKDYLSRTMKDNQRLNRLLYVHPSGFIFRKDASDLAYMKRFLVENTDEDMIRMSFISHVLLRISLITKGQFLLVSEPTWIYVHTERAKDIAHNKAKTGVSVYAPKYLLKRFELSIQWIKKTVPKDLLVGELFNAFRIYLISCTIYLFDRNQSQELQKHYGYHHIEYNIRDERRNCVKQNYTLTKQLGIYTFRYALMCKLYTIRNAIQTSLHILKRRIKVLVYGNTRKQTNS